MTSNFDVFVVYWTKWEGYLFQSVLDVDAANRCKDHRGFHSIIQLRRAHDVPE